MSSYFDHNGSTGFGRGKFANDGGPADLSRVMVVGRSRITQIVVAKIVEGLGLKPVMESPETAARALRSLLPGIIVLDGGSENSDCDALIPVIAALRRATGGLRPALVLLSTRLGATTDALTLSGFFDAVVAKPITPEQLQPVLSQLLS
ncbi:CheY-like chemotaxis protein [Aquamicrobium lusatiense]|uniref:CheY-like chemotaxis protein n=1 Tax=Aquamicrobium lusatiense TaxID=89772 RepID=A0A7W9S1Z6_9HYPH|nr:response regulator [Aquamicrobium lusatiense]MBB6011498.1 CheY-like chemotaxis protein [Aquamicrobium lusatiense]